MSGNRGGGALFDRIGFEARGSASDGYGGTQTGFVEQFSCRAAFIHLRGGEGVLAARLENRHTVVVRVRRSAQTEAVTSDWRIVDKREGTVFAIRDVTPTADRLYVDFLAESGVAS